MPDLYALVVTAGAFLLGALMCLALSRGVKESKAARWSRPLMLFAFALAAMAIGFAVLVFILAIGFDTGMFH